ncbi:MAG: helix-turn-helix transcriptional regulator [Planctomycetes bacterium]|nr:helix-turn-helix transcriptional regulator [Planctomycetota bacterium]
MAKEHSFYSAPFPRDVSNLYIRSVGHSVWAADSRLVRKGWSYYQLLFHTAGAAIGTVDGQKIYAEKNGAWILPKDKTYSYSWDPEIKKWEDTWIEFDGAWVDDALRMMNIHGQYHFPNAENIENLVKRIDKLFHNEGNEALHECAALLLQIFARLEASNRNVERSGKHSENIETIAKKYMAQNFAENIQLEDIAQSCKVTTFHLSRVFKEINGVPPMKYLRQLRIARAKALFHDQDLNTSEIGQAVGYPVLQHFSRMFKQETSMTPRSFVKTISRKG